MYVSKMALIIVITYGWMMYNAASTMITKQIKKKYFECFCTNSPSICEVKATFFISLFTEMFGIPLTIYLLAPLLGVEPRMFGMHESHLWAYFLSRTGLVNIEAGVYLVMVVSTALLVLGFSLLSLGWKEVYRGRGELVVTGLYSRMRHPQYLGLILAVIAFLIQWPTLLTVLLAPFLIGRYILLAREEDRELEEKFGGDFRRYKESVPGFIP